ncbi:MAG: response regulator [Alphaproteobacteria bacterium]|nr:response regulator [Alphaproteobacteria bacterium]
MAPAKSPQLKNILYIDDDRDILSVARLALEKIGGFHVDTCSNSSKGIAVAEATQPDLIMLDVMMPGVDGPSLLRSLKTNVQLCGTPVVFMTARVQSAEMDKYAACGSAGVIPKPFNPMTLPKELNALWQAYQTTIHNNMTCGLEDLRQQYLRNLPTKRAEIEAFWRQVRMGKVSRGGTQKVERVVHNLAGSGEIYGYRALSRSARLLEELLARDPYSLNLCAVIEKLLSAIDRALVRKN